MGHWEQIGVANAEHRRKRAQMPAYRRRIQDALTNGLIVVVSLVLWAAQLASVIVTVYHWLNPR